MSTKKVPLRQCIGCGEMKNKKEMVRILKTESGEITLDATGRKNGRGAHLCPNMECFRKAVKGRGVMLAVSGAFHSPYMTPAVAPFAKELEQFEIVPPTKAVVYANYTAAPYEGDPKATMLSQIDHPVQWVKLIRQMAADGYDTFVETGVGNTLQKLISQILPDARVYRVEDMESRDAAVAELKGAATC